MTQIEVETQTRIDLDPAVEMWEEAFSKLTEAAKFVGNLLLAKE